MFEIAGVNINFSFKVGSLIKVYYRGAEKNVGAPSVAPPLAGPPRYRLNLLILPAERRVEIATLGGQPLWEVELAGSLDMSVSDLRKRGVVLNLAFGDETRSSPTKINFDSDKNFWMVHTQNGLLPFMDYLSEIGMMAYDDFVESGGLEQWEKENKAPSPSSGKATTQR